MNGSAVRRGAATAAVTIPASRVQVAVPLAIATSRMSSAAALPGLAPRMLAAAALALSSFAASAQTCGADLPGKPILIDGPRHRVAFVARPDPIPLDAHFAIDFSVCPKAGATLPQSVRVTATMPEHRHGMNYRPVVTAPQPGRYRAEGLLFHMSGRWEIAFDLVDGGTAERLVSGALVE